MTLTCSNYKFPEGREERRLPFPKGLLLGMTKQASLDTPHFIVVTDASQGSYFCKVVCGESVASAKGKHVYFDGKETFPAHRITSHGRLELVAASCPFDLGTYEYEVSGDTLLMTRVEEPEVEELQTFSIKGHPGSQGIVTMLPRALLELLGYDAGDTMYSQRVSTPEGISMTRGDSRGSGRGTQVKFPETKLVLPFTLFDRVIKTPVELTATVTFGEAWALVLKVKELASA